MIILFQISQHALANCAASAFCSGMQFLLAAAGEAASVAIATTAETRGSALMMRILPIPFR